MTTSSPAVFPVDTNAPELDSGDFKAQALDLRQALLAEQRLLKDTRRKVLIVIAGIDGAGKGSVVHRLNEWMDPRFITTNAFWLESDEEASHPDFWRYWRAMPPRGQMGIFFVSWYSQPIAQLAQANDDATHRLRHTSEGINTFEAMLCDDDTLVVKLWLHVNESTQALQLGEQAPHKDQIPRLPQQRAQRGIPYKDYVNAAQQLVGATHTAHSPWHMVHAEDKHYRDVRAGDILLAAMRQHREAGLVSSTAPVEAAPISRKSLSEVDLSHALKKHDYKKQLRAAQARLQDLAWQAHREDRALVAVFEGWDAAGKGSAIRRVTNAIDPRLYHLVPIAAPTDEEHAQHYLWRFWRKLQRDGHVTLFDRSWYGRVLVERVEGYASETQWQRAYSEINHFERQLVDHGVMVAKFWIHISPEEQLARFEARQNTPHKKHKITPDDWRNRDKWPDYELAVDDMIARTSTEYAPWTLVPGNDKRFARVFILNTLCDLYEAQLGDMG